MIGWSLYSVQLRARLWLLLVMLVASLLVLVAACSAQPFAKEWIQFVDYVDSYGKPYTNDSMVMDYKFKAFLVSIDFGMSVVHPFTRLC